MKEETSEPKPNSEDEDVEPELYAAAKRGNIAEVTRLLDAGADINEICYEWETALQAAASEGHEDVVHLLLKRGADPNTSDALMDSVGINHEKIVRMLLEAGADPSSEWYDMHDSVLMRATRLRFKSIVALLLEFGANANATDSLVDTALDMADDPEIIAILEQAGALHARDLLE